MKMLHKNVSKLFLVCGIFCLFLFSLQVALAKVGVGMGAGEIKLTESVKPGSIYSLPTLRIFNTGDETTTYGMGVAYHQDYHQLRPGEDWFSFSPATFTIEPGKSQEVEIILC